METPQLTLPKHFSGLNSLLGSLPRFAEDKDYKSMSNEQLIEELKGASDFEKFVFPNSWYSKYDLPEKTCMDMRTFLRESPWMKTSQHYYIEKKDIPAKPGGNRPVLPPIEVPALTVVQNSFSDAPTTQTASLCLEDSQQS